MYVCKQVWSVRADIIILDDCGNIYDCASLAVLAALKHFKHPDVTIDGSKVTVVCKYECIYFMWMDAYL